MAYCRVDFAYYSKFVVMNWLFVNFLGLPRFVWFGLAVIALFAGGGIWLHNRDVSNQDLGATKQRNADLERTVKNVEKANNAADEVSRNPDAARDECLRNARNPADC